MEYLWGTLQGDTFAIVVAFFRAAARLSTFLEATRRGSNVVTTCAHVQRGCLGYKSSTILLLWYNHHHRVNLSKGCIINVRQTIPTLIGCERNKQ